MNHFLLKSLKSVVILLAFIFIGQQTNYAQDNPLVDQIPQWAQEKAATSAKLVNEVVTIDHYDNYYIGEDFAEGHISVNPNQPTQFFSVFNVDNPHYSLDGNNWENSNPDWGVNIIGDVVSAYDSMGNLYYEALFGGAFPVGCKVVVSQDNGQNWSPSVTSITGSDKNWIAADQTAGPNANYVYTTMTGSGGGVLARSTDFGASWEQTATFDTQSLPGMMVCVGAWGNTQGGAVYVVTNGGDVFNSTYSIYQSLDGGENFTFMSSHDFPNYVGTELNGRHSVENMRTRPYPLIAADNSFGPYRGRLYLVYASNNPVGNGNKPDIFLRHSDNGGVHWSAALKVNDDNNSQNHHQFMPAIWCDKETGRLYVQWLDTRDTPSSDSALVYATFSDDGGQSFAVNQQISNAKMKLDCQTCGGGGTPRYQGDYNGIVSNGEVSMLAWTDYRNGSFSSYTAYFPDYAFKTYPQDLTIQNGGILYAEVPSTKLYEGYVIISATVETPSSGTFSIVYPEGDTIHDFASALPIKVLADNVPVGEYKITVESRGPNGTPVHFRESSISVLKADIPVADFSASTQKTCQYTTIDFTDESLNSPTSWQWTFEGGVPNTSTDQHPGGIYYPTDGTFDVTLVVSNAEGSDTLTEVDYIVIYPQPDPPITQGASICEGQPNVFISAEGESIKWYDDPELTNLVFEGPQFYPQVTELGTHYFYATQTVINCISDASEVTYTINEVPEVSFGPLNNVCLNADPVKLTQGSPDGGVYVGLGVNGNEFNPLVAGTGIHTLTYLYTDTNNCTNSASQEITVLELPEVYLAFLDTVCSGEMPFELTGGDPEGGLYEGDGVDDGWFYPAVAGAGSHIINYTVLGQNNCTNTAFRELFVRGGPEISLTPDTAICEDQTLVLDATTEGAVSYYWEPTGETTPTITVDTSNFDHGDHRFYVYVESENTCISVDSVDVNISDCSGINEILNEVALNLYPNPSDGKFTIEVTTEEQLSATLYIYNGIGSTIHKEDNLKLQGKQQFNINLQTQPEGIYYITFRTNKGVIGRKLIINN